MVKLSLQVIKSTPYPSIVCSFDNARYVFNVPDGFQRYIKEHKIKMGTGATFMITRLCTTRICGLFGYIQTLVAERAALGCKIYGPLGVTALFNTLRYNDIGGYKTLPYSVQEYNGQQILGIKDYKILDDLLLTKQNDCQLKEQIEQIRELQFDPNTDNNAGMLLKEDTYQDQNLSIFMIPTLNSIQYLIVSNSIPGGVLKEKLDEFQIKGKLTTELLKNGQVTLQDGTIVKDSQVRSPITIPQAALILDIRTQEELQLLEQSDRFQQLLKQVEQKQVDLSAIFHLSKSVNQQHYIDFIQRYQQFDNILCCYSAGYNNFEIASHQITNYLNKHYPNNFPNVHEIYTQIPNGLQDIKTIYGYQALSEYIVVPKKSQGYKPMQNIQPDKLIQMAVLPEYEMPQEPKDHRQLTFLGTCSMKPGRYRNVSGIMIENRLKQSFIIMDCGEGTLQQIKDQGIDMKHKHVLIWISHCHSDHHMGILQILYDIAIQNDDKDIYIVVPAVMIPWLLQYQQIVNEHYKVKFILAQQFEHQELDIAGLIEQQFLAQRVRYGPSVNNIIQVDYVANYTQLLDKMEEQFDLSKLTVAQVDHCDQAYGINLLFKDGKKVAYSGDTRPCQSFIDLAKSTDIIIHEATFSNDLQVNAETNKHSTIGEAIEVGQKCNSETIVLTHFSQRYAKGMDQVAAYDKNIIFAFDHLSGSMNEYKHLGQMSKAIQSMFIDE